MRRLVDPIYNAPPAPRPALRPIWVSELAQRVKRAIHEHAALADVSVRGEISNYKLASSGHIYFSLKDQSAQINCCLWRDNVPHLVFRPADGNRVVARGKVEYYPARGQVNLVVEELGFDGPGAHFEAYERLRLKLAAEGLFDDARKKPLPAMPRRIGLITSPTGAAAHDVLTVLQRRWPLATVVFVSARVQGFEAAPDLIRALSWAAAGGDLDLVIVARGGGSLEDLWAFNDEDLVRVAANFPLPLISAVGHETDFTLFDFVADRRAPTPSAAAEMASPDALEVHQAVRALRRRIINAATGELFTARNRLNTLRERTLKMDPRARLQHQLQQLEQLRSRAAGAAQRIVRAEARNLTSLRARLHSLDPERVLERGYALVKHFSPPGVVTSVAQTHPGQHLQIVLHDGSFEATVISAATSQPHAG